MKVRTPIRRAWRTVPLFAAAALGACDAGDGPTAPSPESAAPVDPIVVAGRVDVAAAPAGVPATTSAPGDPSGLLVTLEGTGAVDTTDARGNFRLEGRVEDGRVRLRFRRGALDVSLELEGVTPGAMLRLEVVLENEGASVTRARQGARAEAEGLATLLEVGGEEPGRVIRVQVRDEDDGRVTTAEVEIAEGVTRLDPEGDLTSFADLLAALEAEVEVELEGEGALQEDGSIAAAEVKAETEEDDDGDDDEGEFEGTAALLSVTGEAPGRTLRVEVREEDDGRVTTAEVEIAEGVTRLDPEGDLTSFADLLAALEAGVEVELEGEGALQEDGSIAAAEVKAETED